MNLNNTMGIKIIKAGMFTTVQDIGRVGFRSAGIGVGGAMDVFAAAVANCLVGNDERAAVVEMHFPAAEMLFDEAALVSITGGNFGATLNGEPVSLWQPFFVRPTDRLVFKKYINGARAYLAVHGGITADNWLNSFSTHTKVKAGGFRGRALLKEDVLPFNKKIEWFQLKNFPDFTSMMGPVYQPGLVIRCIAGVEWEWLNEWSQDNFLESNFVVTAHSDRMGFRLKGTSLSLHQPVELISSPVDMGTIQLLPNGQLIVLMADYQTTGGYPRVGNVISADLPKLAQSRIHSQIQFKMIAPENAEDALFSFHQNLNLIKTSCNNFYDAHRSQL
jgi:antagonist of KipI